MIVSDYLSPVLDAAVAHAATVAVFDDVSVDVSARNKLSAARQTALTAAWASAAQTVEVLAAADSDAAWAEWERLGPNTTAYKAFALDADLEDPDDAAVIAVYASDVRVTDTAAPPVISPRAANIDLKPVVVSLGSPTGRPSGLADIAAYARRRLNLVLAQIRDRGRRPTLWELWRIAGGDREPEYLEWVETRGHHPTGPTATGDPVDPPHAPKDAWLFRAGAVGFAEPPEAEKVTGYEIEVRSYQRIPGRQPLRKRRRVVPAASAAESGCPAARPGETRFYKAKARTGGGTGCVYERTAEIVSTRYETVHADCSPRPGEFAVETEELFCRYGPPHAPTVRAMPGGLGSVCPPGTATAPLLGYWHHTRCAYILSQSVTGETMRAVASGPCPAAGTGERFLRTVPLDDGADAGDCIYLTPPRIGIPARTISAGSVIGTWDPPHDDVHTFSGDWTKFAPSRFAGVPDWITSPHPGIATAAVRVRNAVGLSPPVHVALDPAGDEQERYAPPCWDDAILYDPDGLADDAAPAIRWSAQFAPTRSSPPPGTPAARQTIYLRATATGQTPLTDSIARADSGQAQLLHPAVVTAAYKVEYLDGAGADAKVLAVFDLPPR